MEQGAVTVAREDPTGPTTKTNATSHLGRLPGQLVIALTAYREKALWKRSMKSLHKVPRAFAQRSPLEPK